LIVGAITLVAGGLRLYRLAQPDEKVFDEVYYASDGCLYAGHPFADCGLKEDTERSWVHPPLGKMLIAAGIDWFGNRPFGWRITAALAGTATVALVGALAFVLFASPAWAAVATLLAGTEHLLFVQSRIAMLDVFLAFFVVVGFVFLAADRRRDERMDAESRDAELPGAEPTVAELPGAEPTVAELPGAERTVAEQTVADPAVLPRPGPLIRPLQLAAGAAFGAAIAVKWSGYLALLGGLVLAIAWTTRRIRRREATRQEILGLAISFVVVPFAVYLATWIPWFADRAPAGPATIAGVVDVGEWIGHHAAMADYHFGLDTIKENGEPIHPYMSRAWSWLLLTRPVAYFWEGEPNCCAEILGIGNPLLFWGAFLVIPYLVLAWRGRRDWRAGGLLVAILSQFLPWLAVSRPLFLFYMAPVTPFLAVGTVYAIRDLLGLRLDSRLALAGAAAVVGVSVALFAFFWPVLTASTISLEAWQDRMWFGGWV
jgi:dolichyl-phosphate-mannose-protein mannosyltransferase